MALIFKIKIKGSSNPPIWRKIKIDESVSFDELYIAIQVAFGWDNDHMYQFSPKGYGSKPALKYEYGDDFDDMHPFSNPSSFPHGEYYNAELIKLKGYFKNVKQKMIYIYDFGDDWEHIIELVEITDERSLFPVCISGKGSNLMEDSGGIWGFYAMLEIIEDPEHPEHESYMEWMGLEKGETWDMNEFDKKGTNILMINLWKEMKK